jgi:hypothetical protein
MKWKANVAVAGILLAALLSACAGAGGYGSMRVVEDGSMTLDTLVTNSQNYEQYWAGFDPSIPVAVLFDPKNDGKTLQVGPRWGRVSDQAALSKMTGFISQTLGTGGFPPKLRVILGPDGSTFGWVYTNLNHLVIHVIDDKTMLVESVG